MFLCFVWILNRQTTTSFADDDKFQTIMKFRSLKASLAAAGQIGISIYLARSTDALHFEKYFTLKYYGFGKGYHFLSPQIVTLECVVVNISQTCVFVKGLFFLLGPEF